MSTEARLRRFSPAQRLFHVTLMLCFAIQSATGLARLFSETPWGQGVGRLFGGYEASLTVHKYVGLCMLALFVAHVLYLLATLRRRGLAAVLGPDSIAPAPADLKQFFQHVGWMLGLTNHPRFDRWGYWEKFDYWAVFWGMAIIGGTGLLLWDPLASSALMPGWGINLALWVHRLEAALAMAHVFLIHFFIGHLRPHSFPMDMAMFEGSVSLEASRGERAAWVERLEQTGALPGALVQPAAPARRLLFLVFGFAVMAFCLYLLVGGLANVTRVTW
ncbi:MAG: cytochrome b/b6 domain-containing protein [Desulfarculus sp.]|nr:cytochrome b/b6 domain-containing protein [Desulfarculus sp.]